MHELKWPTHTYIADKKWAAIDSPVEESFSLCKQKETNTKKINGFVVAALYQFYLWHLVFDFIYNI